MQSPARLRRHTLRMTEGMKPVFCANCGNKFFPPKGACPKCRLSLNGYYDGEKADQAAAVVLLDLAKNKNGQ